MAYTCGICNRPTNCPEGLCYECSCEAHASGEIDMDNDPWRGPVESPRSEYMDDSQDYDLPMTPEELEAAKKIMAEGRAKRELVAQDIPF